MDHDKYPSYGDEKDLQSFLVVNNVRQNGQMFLDFLPTFTKNSGKYQSVFRVVVADEDLVAFKYVQNIS